MYKINKHTIESLKVNDKELIWQFQRYEAVRGNLFRSSKPERWGCTEHFAQSEQKINEEGLCMIFDGEIYTRPNFTIKMISGEKIIHRFDTYKQAEKFAYEYVKKNNLIDFINKY